MRPSYDDLLGSAHERVGSNFSPPFFRRYALGSRGRERRAAVRASIGVFVFIFLRFLQ